MTDKIEDIPLVKCYMKTLWFIIKNAVDKF